MKVYGMSHSTTPRTIPLWYISANFGLRLRKIPNSQNEFVLYGERGIGLDKFKKTAAARLIEKHTNNLIKKLLLLFLGAAATGILFFSVLHTGISWGLDSFFYKSDYLEHAEQRTVENLQEYIQEGALTPFDSDL